MLRTKDFGFGNNHQPEFDQNWLMAEVSIHKEFSNFNAMPIESCVLTKWDSISPALFPMEKREKMR